MRTTLGALLLMPALALAQAPERGEQVLSIDGYRGYVILVDLASQRRRSANAAKVNKKDL